jgi:hypothetical protein
MSELPTRSGQVPLRPPKEHETAAPDRVPEMLGASGTSSSRCRGEMGTAVLCPYRERRSL